MTNNTSKILIAAIAGIVLAGALALALPMPVRADQFAGNGGIGGAGGAGGVAGSGGSNTAGDITYAGNHQSANGGDANGGAGGSANGGNICNHVRGHTHTGEVCGSS